MTITLNRSLSHLLWSGRDLGLLMGVATILSSAALRRTDVYTKLNLANWVQEIVTGAFVIAAVVLDRLRRCGPGST